MRYRPELDGIRALAVLAVLASHSGIPAAHGGWLGVDVFFVLSGYLITTLLLAEHAISGRIDLGRFYARRVLRLYPALVLVLLVGLAFHRVLGDGSLASYGRSAAYAGLYLQDFVAGFTGRVDGGFGHTWSLAIEEQFYLVWPVVLTLLLRYRRNPLAWAVAGVVLGWASMIVSLRPSATGLPVASYYLPWNRFPQLLVGCALAVVVARGRVPRVVGRSAVGWASAVVGVVLALAAARLGRYPGLAWQAPAIALTTAVLVWHLAADRVSSLRRVLSLRPLVWLGRRSYGVYLIHVPVLEVLQAQVPWRRSVVAAVMVVLTVALAALSYRFVELPFLRVKARLRAPAADAADGTERRGDAPSPPPTARPVHAGPTPPPADPTRP